MAQRRMFSLKIVDADAFLDMPQSSQLLYFHLSMRADDDGFVSNPKKIMRMIGSQEDDYKVLLTKRFLIPFENGVCVIKHWKMHNYIQNDRYTETVYLDEKRSLELKENGAYTECIQNGYNSDTQVRLEVGKSKVRIEKEDTHTKYGEFENVLLTSEEYEKLCTALGVPNTDSLIAELSSYLASSGKRYRSHYATLQNWARRKVQEHKNKPTKGKQII